MPAYRRAIPTVIPLAALLLAGCARDPAPPPAVQTTLPAIPGAPDPTESSIPAQFPAIESVRVPALKGRVDSRTFENDFNGDGIADERTVISYRYDASGAEIGRIIEEDFDADGAIDSRRSTVTAYQQVGVEH